MTNFQSDINKKINETIAQDADNQWRLETPGIEGWTRTARPGDPNKYLMISADGHLNEDRNFLYDRLDEKFRNRIPRVVIDEDGHILRSQTSTVQIRVMEKTKPPIRVIAPGRVFRPDAIDASHHHTFHQLEGLAVDTDITFADLKGVLTLFARALYGEGVTTRFRPSFFPFTEPSAEMDISCPFCSQSGCAVCKYSGWVELLGCGMVDPNVFEAVGYDSNMYTGFAFGMGIDRLAMMKYGINDIRLFLENDLRFVRQF